MHTISDNPLQDIRVELGLTQQQLAVRLGLTTSAVSRLERRDRLPILHYLALLQLRFQLQRERIEHSPS